MLARTGAALAIAVGLVAAVTSPVSARTAPDPAPGGKMASGEVTATTAPDPAPGGQRVGGEVTAMIAPDPAPGGQIIGGEVADWASYPYYAVVDGSCGGAVIAAGVIVTAAHCVGGGPVAIRLVDTTTTSNDVVVHPLWNGDVGDGHDLAVVRVPASDTAGAAIIQAGAPSRPDIYRADRFAEVVGTGQTDDDDASSGGTLRAVTGRIRSDGYMADIYDPWYLELFSNYRSGLMIGFGSRTKTTCFGDSGAPLVSHNGPSPRTLIGVSSFGWPWCSRPGVFGELDGAHLAWLATEVPSIRDRWACGQGDDEGRMRVRYEPFGDNPHRDYAGYFRYYSWELRCVYPSWEAEPLPEIPNGNGGSGRTVCVSDKWWLCDPDLR